MKKTILAMAVPALMVAGAANASVDVYDANGVNVKIGGEMEVQYKQGHTKDTKGKFRLDEGKLSVETGVEISNDLSKGELSKTEDVDMFKASSDFKQTEAILQSTLMASNKLLQPSLMNFLQ